MADTKFYVTNIEEKEYTVESGNKLPLIQNTLTRYHPTKQGD